MFRTMLTFTLPGPEAYASDTPQPAGLLCNPESLPPNFGRSNFCHQAPPRPHDARDPSSERWNFVGRELFYLIWPTMSTSTLHVRIFYMPQICDMVPAALLPIRRNACWGFSALKNPTASAGFEPANLGIGQHAYP
jgi:hypothetical protein